MILIFFVAILLYCCWLLREWLTLYVTNFRIVGPRSLPLIGSIFAIQHLRPNNLANTLVNYRKCYGETFRIWLGPKLWIFLHTPQETKELLTNVNLEKSNAFDLMRPIFGNSVLMRNGKDWKQHRRLIDAGFHMNFIKKSQQKIFYHSDIFICNIKNSNKQLMEISESLFNFMVDATVDIFMGKNLKIQLGENYDFLHAIHRLDELFFQRMINPLLFTDFIYKLTSMSDEMSKYLNIVYNVIDNIIDERKCYLDQPATTINDKYDSTLLEILLRSSMEGNLTIKEIREELNTLLFAGVDTTSMTLSYALYALAKYPQEQLKVYEEIENIKRIYNATSCNNDEANNEDADNYYNNYLMTIHKCKYLDLFLKETLRMYTTVPCTGRKIITPTRIGQHIYGSGVNIWTNFYGLCHDPQYFPEPQRFWPERFLHDIKNPLLVYLPFSITPRICIGRKWALITMKAFIIKILEVFHLSLEDDSKELSFKIELVLKPKNGIHINFTNRV